MKIIMFGGKQCSGKTTAADYLVEKYGAIKLSFAYKLKEIAKELFEEEMKGDNTDRRFYIAVGQKMREIDSTVWAKQVVRIIKKLSKQDKKLFVIDDWRFRTEFETMKKEFKSDLVSLILERDIEKRKTAPKYYALAEGDISEKDLENIEEWVGEIDDYSVLPNDDELETLYHMLDVVMRLSENGKKPKFEGVI